MLFLTFPQAFCYQLLVAGHHPGMALLRGCFLDTVLFEVCCQIWQLPLLELHFLPHIKREHPDELHTQVLGQVRKHSQQDLTDLMLSVLRDLEEVCHVAYNGNAVNSFEAWWR